MQALLKQLEAQTPGGYSTSGPLAAEPTAWSAIALTEAGRTGAASRAADWLADLQASDGSVGVEEDATAPAWTTSLAILAWKLLGNKRYQQHISHGVQWTLAAKGTTNPQRSQIGHNTMLVGWSWAADTHSWVEPTAFAVMALRAAGKADHPRVKEAVNLLADRLLPDGGCNYGNTKVLGQTLLPHLQPTGIVLWALAAFRPRDPRIEKSLSYLEQKIEEPTGCASLAYALIGLTAWGCRPASADHLLGDAAHRPGTVTSTYKLALLWLASQPSHPLVAPGQ